VLEIKLNTFILQSSFSAVALLLKAALIQVSDYRLLGASGYSVFLNGEKKDC
jgi:hypothetical protein